MASNDSNECIFSETCGKNVKVDGSLVTWQSVESGGRVFIDQPLLPNNELSLTFSENGHADVGILKKNPNSLSNLQIVDNLQELTVIQVARIYKKTGIIEIKRSSSGDKITTKSVDQPGDQPHILKVRQSEQIWITVNILFGTLKVLVAPAAYGFSQRKGENINTEGNEACLKYANPCAVCYLKYPLSVGEVLVFQIDPIVYESKSARNFSTKIAVSQTSPEEFFDGLDTFYDITCFPVLPVENFFKKAKNEVKVQLEAGDILRIHCNHGKLKKKIPFTKAFLIFEISRVSVKCISKRNQTDILYNRSDSSRTNVLPDQSPVDMNVADGIIIPPEQSDSIYISSELKSIQQEAEIISESMMSNDDNISVHSTEVAVHSLVQSTKKLPSNGDEESATCSAAILNIDPYSFDNLHQTVKDLSIRLKSVELKISELSKSKNDPVQNTENYKSTIEKIKNLLQHFNERSFPTDPECLHTRQNMLIEGKSFCEMVQEKYTQFVRYLDTKPLLDNLFQNGHIVHEEHERLRKQSQTDREEANRELLGILVRRQSLDVKKFIRALEETNQDGILSHLRKP